MSKRKRDRKRAPDEGADAADQPSADVDVGDWTSRQRVRWRAFPGPEGADALLRVALEPDAFAAVASHAKSQLDREICGVLVGDLCEDEKGTFVHVSAIVEGEHASAGAGHVTFTQETWSAIHETLESDHPKQSIVGWYHSHPGFGVEFSDMDEFIHENFFASQTQVAMVTDPLGGEDAFCINTEGGIRYLDRVWIGGRERHCHVPRSEAEGERAGGSPEGGEAFEQVQLRMTQLVQEVEGLRATHHRFLLGLALFVCLAVVGYTIYGIVDRSIHKREPPKTLDVIPVALEVDGEDVLIQLEVKKWKLPKALKSDMQKKIEAQTGQIEALESALMLMREREDLLLRTLEEMANEAEGADGAPAAGTGSAPADPGATDR